MGCLTLLASLPAAAGFPPSSLSVYDELYPIDRIICPHCKKNSNGAMPLAQRCGCFTNSLTERLDPMYLAQRLQSCKALYQWTQRSGNKHIVMFCFSINHLTSESPRPPAHAATSPCNPMSTSLINCKTSYLPARPPYSLIRIISSLKPGIVQIALTALTVILFIVVFTGGGPALSSSDSSESASDSDSSKPP
jgi:hypothetical protein